LGADVLFIRAQSAIRADGAPSAQARALQLDVFSYPRRCRRDAVARSRAPTVFFGTNEKRIRTKNTVMDKDKDSEEGYTASRPRTIAPL